MGNSPASIDLYTILRIPASNPTELTYPLPNIQALFVQLDKTFFWSRLIGKIKVKWNKRLYSTPGLCSNYNHKRILCQISLSEPLLQLRSRKDLVETLLHEMIHAYCFLTTSLQVVDRDYHGPMYQYLMNRINTAAGLNVSIRHDFHSQDELLNTNRWRCNGRCQSLAPHFGVLNYRLNKPPGPSAYWWEIHQAKCGGTITLVTQHMTDEMDTTENQDITNNDVINNVNVIQADSTISDTSTVELKDPNIQTLNTLSNSSNNTGQGQPFNHGSQIRDPSKAATIAWESEIMSRSSNPIKHKATDSADSQPKKVRKIDGNQEGGDKVETGSEKHSKEPKMKCACCEKVVNKSMFEHLEECIFFKNVSIKFEEGEPAGYTRNHVNEHDDFNEFNPTGTKYPCPGCLKMVEAAEMNVHLDVCLCELIKTSNTVTVGAELRT